MKLPYDLLSQSYKKPDIYLCDVDKSKMCKLNATGARGSFKFHSYSELSFETSRTYLDSITGETKINPFYDKIETPRLIKLDGFGYFEIQGPELTGNGIKESRTVTAYSLEYTLSTKYLEKFQINTGAAESVEVGYAYDTYYEQYGEDYINYIAPVTLYNDANHKLSLLHLAIEKAYGWKIGHVDDSLKTLSRKFEVDRQSIYDFLMNEVCAKFNCYVIFDTETNEINVYAESKTSKFIGDGVTNQFTISPKFDDINTVSVDGYKTTKWEYNSSTGVLTLEDTPESGAHIEVIDGALTEWETDVFVTYENLAHEIKVSYDSDEIKTQLTVTYGDDLDIREANRGIPYLTDLSYYYTVDWMGQDLYDAYTAYLQKSQNIQAEYTKNAEEMLDVANRQNFEEMRLSMGYGEASVLPTTVGTYYVRGGSAPNYYYTEVSLPADYDASVQYYKLNGTNINTGKVTKLYEALQKYFNDGSLDDFVNDPEDDSDLADSFSFVTTYQISNLYNDLKAATTKEEKEIVVNQFLDEMWNEVGRTPLKKSYKEPYEKQQTQFIDYAKEDHKDYSYYYTTVLILDSIKRAIDARTKSIEKLEKDYQDIQKRNANISSSLAMDQNFTENQLIRLSAFIREDELPLDDIVETDEDTIADSFKIKEDAIESGRIELHKLSQPKLQFSMTMANIYAIKAFEPIIDQFQLGNVIKVGLRKDYIKQSRLLQVDLEFDNLSSLSTEFGELTNLRTQSDIHADLLGQAISAGKSVAQNSANWTKGSDTATNTDLRIQNGLLDAATVLKAMDGTQSSEIDKFGIHLKKVDSSTGEIDPKQGWLVNNMFAYTDDNWKTTKTVLGEFKLRGEDSSRWGLLADAVIAGYVEGSHIIGGDVKIGDIGTQSFPFQVNSDGDMVATSATIKGNSTIAGWNVTDNQIHKIASNGSASMASSGNWAFMAGGTDYDNENSNAKFRVGFGGDVHATSGDIGSWTLNEKGIYKNNDTIGIGLWSTTDHANIAIHAGADTEHIASAPFKVYYDGKLVATKGEIGGWSLLEDMIIGENGDYEARMNKTAIGTANSVVFGVYNGSEWSAYIDGVGKLVASGAKIEGDIEATTGKIANWMISGNTISSTANNYRLRLDSGACGKEGDDWISVYDTTNQKWPFYVTGTGQLVASGATISGKITATDGEIGGWSIDTDKIEGVSGNYKALIAKSAIGASGNVVFGVYNGSEWSCYMDGVGKLYARGADIGGKITAISGKIGGWNLEPNTYGYQLTSGTPGTSGFIGLYTAYNTDEDYRLRIGTKFSVDKDGVLNANGGTFNYCTIDSTCTINGTISANQITGGTIDASKITVTNLDATNITSGNLSANKISGGTLSGCAISIGDYFNVNTSGYVSLGYIKELYVYGDGGLWDGRHMGITDAIPYMNNSVDQFLLYTLHGIVIGYGNN